jgi:hypothetical protein
MVCLTTGFRAVTTEMQLKGTFKILLSTFCIVFTHLTCEILICTPEISVYKLCNDTEIDLPLGGSSATTNWKIAINLKSCLPLSLFRTTCEKHRRWYVTEVYGDVEFKFQNFTDGSWTEASRKVLWNGILLSVTNSLPECVCDSVMNCSLFESYNQITWKCYAVECMQHTRQLCILEPKMNKARNEWRQQCKQRIDSDVWV